MTDLERVREWLAGRGHGETWAAAIIDAHLKEDEEWREAYEYSRQMTDECRVELARLREALADHACGSGCTYPTHEGLLR